MLCLSVCLSVSLSLSVSHSPVLCLSACLSDPLCIYLCVCVCVCVTSVCLSACLSLTLSKFVCCPCLLVCPTTPPRIYLSTHLSISVSVCVCYVCLCVCLSVSLSHTLGVRFLVLIFPCVCVFHYLPPTTPPPLCTYVRVCVYEPRLLNQDLLPVNDYNTCR